MTCRRSGRSCARRPRTITGSRRSWWGLYRVMHSACRRWRSEDHVSDQKASFPQDVAQGRGRLRRTAVARRDDPGRYRARQDRRRAEAAGGLLQNSPRRGQGEHKHGKAMDRWTPSGAGADFKLSPILEPLEKHKHAVISIANLENKASVASVHKYNPATWLSGVKPDLKAPGPS